MVIEPETDLGKSRLEICMNCDWFRKNTMTCRQCGCGVNMKVDRKENACPIGKW
jgi:hypothetical protein